MRFDPFEQAKKINLVELIRDKYGLDPIKSGNTLFVSCPKAGPHGDTTPSLAIYPEKNRFYCYHCGDWKGSPIDFIMGMENTDAKGALKVLDAMYPSYGLLDSKEKQRYELVAQAYAYLSDLSVKLHSNLINNEQHMRWLNKKRGFSKSSITHFQLGIMEYSGVPRLMIPHFDSYGVCGFTSRQMVKNDTRPRYLSNNTYIDTVSGKVIWSKSKTTSGSTPIPLYVKGNHLYNLNKVTGNEVVLVEGQLDVIAGWELDVKNMVAMGTLRLSENQAELLSDFKSIVIIPDVGAFDSVMMNAATLRSVNPGQIIKVVDLSPWAKEGEKTDVGDMLVLLTELNDFELFEKIIENAQLFELWQYNQTVRPHKNNQAKAIEELGNILEIATHSVSRAALLGVASKDLDIPIEALMSLERG